MPNEKPFTAPSGATPSELELEFRNGIPSSVELPLPSDTVGERLKRVYPEYYVRILQEMTRQNGPEHTTRVLTRKALPTELICAFLWGNTSEGHAFWAELARREQS